MSNINENADLFLQNVANKTLPFQWYIRISYDDVSVNKINQIIPPKIGYNTIDDVHVEIENIRKNGFSIGGYYISAQVIKMINAVHRDDIK